MLNQTASADHDPYLWLEDIDSPAAHAWVEARNAQALAALCDDQFEADRAAMLAILDAPDRIAYVRQRGGFVYNFWQDAQNPKGIWRRTSLAGYRSDTPEWETLIDVDALARAEGEDWVWQGCTSLPPEHRHCLVQLSRGGADATVTREFDLVDKRFVPDGFSLPEAKGGAAFVDADTLLVTSALGGEEFQTTSGYARTVRRWRRGTPFEEAPVIFSGERTDMIVYGWCAHSPARSRTILAQKPEFFRQRLFVEEAGALQRIDIPDDAIFAFGPACPTPNLRSDWTIGTDTYPAGALLVIGFDEFMAGRRDFSVLFRPTERCFLQHFDAARDVIALNILDNVRSRIWLARCRGGTWRVEPVEDFPEM